MIIIKMLSCAIDSIHNVNLAVQRKQPKPTVAQTNTASKKIIYKIVDHAATGETSVLNVI